MTADDVIGLVAFAVILAAIIRVIMESTNDK